MTVTIDTNKIINEGSVVKYYGSPDPLYCVMVVFVANLHECLYYNTNSGNVESGMSQLSRSPAGTKF